MIMGNQQGIHIRDVTAMVLVGGLGTRLRSVICDRPKVLAPVHGRPFLAYLLDQIASSGITKVVLCTGYRAEQIVETFGRKYGKLDLSYSPEPRPLGTAGALRLALPLVQSQTVLAMNGDSFCDVDLRAFDSWAASRHTDASIVAVGMENASRYGALDLEDDRVVGFQEKAPRPGFGWINAGIYSFRRDFLCSLPLCGPFSLEKDVFERQLCGELSAFRHCGHFLDIGTPESLASAESFLAQEF